MTAEIVKIDPARPEAAYSRARDVIRAGGVIAYPTDTFYGLGVDPRNAAAVKKLFVVKGRRQDQPILLLIADAAAVREWAEDVPATATPMMDRHWPGPLTLVFTAKEHVLPELTAGTGKIGLRVPGNELTRALIRFLGTALTGTSANRSGGPDPLTAGDVLRAVGERLDLILDAGPAPGGMPSTVVDVSVPTPRVIRQGAVAVE
jgi:L-threonylcarbamoyladenylate synthase